MNFSKLFSLKKEDWLNAVVHAVGAGAFLAIGSAVSQAGFDIFSANWTAIFHTATNATIAVFFASLGINFSANEEGKILGMRVK